VDDVVFVVSGTLDARKRAADVLKALPGVEDPKCKVWFLGSGPLWRELQELAVSLGIQDRLYWWGFRNQTEMPRILQAADVLLHLSERDPWPYAVLEGAMSGLALLLSDRTGSHPDFIQTAGAGETFRCTDIQNLRDKMSFFVKNPSARIAYKKAAVVESTKYSETSFCDIFEETVNKLLDE
jgi:glycosyltransferase involved in cell wall biosynthesis